MSFEFKITRSNHKRGRKFNRHQIWNKMGDVKHISMHKQPLGWLMNIYDWAPDLWDDTNKFIGANVGKDVNEVYSKYLKHLRSPKHYLDRIKEFFFDRFAREDNGFYRKFKINDENKIEKIIEPIYKPHNKEKNYNKKHLNDLINKDTKFVNGPVYIGKLYNSDYKLIPVWVISQSKWNFIKGIEDFPTYWEENNWVVYCGKDCKKDSRTFREYVTINAPIVKWKRFLTGFNKANLASLEETINFDLLTKRLTTSEEHPYAQCYFITK